MPDKMARSEGFEPPTLGIEIRCSIQLSYERPDPGEWATTETHRIVAGKPGTGGVRMGSN